MAREKRNKKQTQSNMKTTVIPIVVGALGTNLKGPTKGQEY